MLDQTDPRIEQAKRLIEVGQQSEAHSLLTSFLKHDVLNTEALYLYAQVARNPQESIEALRRVLDLDPLNYHARAHLNKLEKRSVEQLSQSQPPDRKHRTNISLYWLAAVALLVLIIAGGLALLFFT